MKGAIVFALAMFLIMPTTKNLLSGRLGAFGEWLGAWAPLSYLIVALILAAPVAAIRMMATIPKQVEPENPMAKYLRESAPPVDED
jgi:hypothetical protein